MVVGDQGAVCRPQGKEENGIPLAWCRGGGRCTKGGPTCQRLAKKRDTEGDWGAHRRVHGRGGSIKHNWPLCCAGREGGTGLKRRRGVGTPGVTDEAKLAKQHTISPRLMTVPTEFRGPLT